MNQRLVQKIFLDLFPPPRFLEMPAAGIDISDEVVRLVELKKKDHRYEVKHYAQAELPHDAIEEGYIKNKEGIAKVLSALREKYGLHFVRASLPEDKAYLFKTEIPLMAEADIHNALQFKIEENVPISLSDAVFDYSIIERTADHINLTVTVIHTKVVSSYLDVFRMSGLVPVRFMIESQAIASVLRPHDDMSSFIIAAIRETKTVVCIVSQGVVQFTSSLPISGQSITESIKRNFSVNKEEATKIREGTEQKENNEIMLSIANSTSVLRDEIQKLLTYWQSHGPTGNPINRIVLSGSDALLGLDDYLVRSLSMPVSIGNPLQNIMSLEDYVPPFTKREALDYTSALGLAHHHD